jgi:Tfp pilus assembly protein PilF
VMEALLQAERLLVHGMLDQAEQIYANAFAQDPRNAIAMVGLARVALERGDERLAYERAREALTVDPQNAAALRLEARLAEVMAAREERDLAAEGHRPQ